MAFPVNGESLGPLKFNEADLSEQLSKLPTTVRAAFAAACAQRMVHAYSQFALRSKQGNSEALKQILASLWKDLNGHPMSDSELDAQREAAMALSPQEEDEWIPGQGAAEDAAASLTYALRCRRNGSVHEAVWAARRAYEAIDEHIINREDIDINSREGEERILKHPLMQTELSRQARDLDDLREGRITIEQLRQRSATEAADFLGAA